MVRDGGTLTFWMPRTFSLKLIILFLFFFTTSKFSDDIKSHEQSLDKNNSRDYVDSFITEMQKFTNEENTTFNCNKIKNTILFETND